MAVSPKQIELSKKIDAIMTWLDSNKGLSNKAVMLQTKISVLGKLKTMHNTGEPHAKEKTLNKHLQTLKTSFSLETELVDTNAENVKEMFKIIELDQITIETTKETEYYIYYYCNSDSEVDVSLLALTDNKANWKTFDNKTSKIDLEYEGTYNESDNDKMTIHFVKEMRKGKAQQTSVPSFCCFEEERNDRRIGVYSHSGNVTACGKVIIERVQENEWQDAINNNSIPGDIETILYRKRLVPNSWNVLNELSRRLLNKSERIKGVYEGFVYYQDNSTEETEENAKERKGKGA